MRYDRLVVTRHARLRLLEREIPERVVIDVINDPDQTYQSDDAMVAERVFADGKPWRVVFTVEVIENETIVRIVTVHRLKKVKAQ